MDGHNPVLTRRKSRRTNIQPKWTYYYSWVVKFHWCDIFHHQWTTEDRRPQYPANLIQKWDALKVPIIINSPFSHPSLKSVDKMNGKCSKQHLWYSVFVPWNKYKTVAGILTWNKLQGLDDSVKNFYCVFFHSIEVSFNTVLLQG